MDPAAAYDDHVLVHCLACDACAVIDERPGVVRRTCPQCGFVKDASPHTGEAVGRPWLRFAHNFLSIYNSGETIFGERLWFGGEVLRRPSALGA